MHSARDLIVKLFKPLIVEIAFVERARDKNFSHRGTVDAFESVARNVRELDYLFARNFLCISHTRIVTYDSA